MTKLLVVDTETGGLHPDRCSLLTLGAVVWEDGRLIATTLTNHQGRYDFQGVKPIIYIVRPKRAGFQFDPPFRRVDLSTGADNTSVSFTALPTP